MKTLTKERYLNFIQNHLYSIPKGPWKLSVINSSLTNEKTKIYLSIKRETLKSSKLLWHEYRLKTSNDNCNYGLQEPVTPDMSK